MTRSLLSTLTLGALLAGCAPGASTVNYIVSTNSSYTCCRTIRYSTTTFSGLESSRLKGEGVIVRLEGDSLVARCGADAELPLVIANNSDNDIFIPISRELEGDRLKLYPWRFLYANGVPMRLARQIQYGDLLDRTDSRLLFHRLPSGSQVRLRGVIPSNWLCAPATPIPEGYLERELNPTFYSDYSRRLRAADVGVIDTVNRRTLMRYDVAYTSLDIWKGLPGSATEWNPARDTAQIHIAVTDEPATFLNASQRVAESNSIRLVLGK
jgi:hypothetical protein